jgi:ribosomal protein S18 acetylase RimI-like enzyme
MINQEFIDLIQVTSASEANVALKAIYEEAFPSVERRDWEQVLELIDKPEYNLFSIISHQKIIGILICWSLSDFTFIEHFAIEKSVRSKGFGKLVINSILTKFSGPVILEVE